MGVIERCICLLCELFVYGLVFDGTVLGEHFITGTSV